MLFTNGDVKGKLSRAAIVGDSEKPQLECDFLLMEGAESGKVIRSYMSFTGGARPITLRSLELLGWDPNTDLDNTFPYHKEVTLNLYDEEWQGTKRTKVRVNDPLRGAKPLEEKVAKNFLGELSKAYKAERKAAGVGAVAYVAPKTNGAPAGSEEDIPF